MAFLFGLVHGLGFAGALKEIGLPENHLAVALLTFNGGVEIGQLLVVGAAALQLRAPALYAIGGLAAFWTFGRVAALVA